MENNKKIPSWLKWLPLIGFLIFWEVVSNSIERGVFYYGSPSTVAKALYNKTVDGSLWIDTAATLLEVIVGFVIGNILGTFLGLAFWYNRYLSAIIRPYILVAGAIPAVAFAPIVILFFGIGIKAKIVLVIFSTVVVATVQAFEGANRANENYIRLLQSLGASRWQIFQKIIVPSSLFWLFTGFKLNIGFAILGAFVGEYISSEVGLGHMIILAQGLFNTPVVLAGIVMIALVSIVLTAIISYFQKRLLPWEHSTTEQKQDF